MTIILVKYLTQVQTLIISQHDAYTSRFCIKGKPLSHFLGKFRIPCGRQRHSTWIERAFGFIANPLRAVGKAY